MQKSYLISSIIAIISGLPANIFFIWGILTFVISLPLRDLIVGLPVYLAFLTVTLIPAILFAYNLKKKETKLRAYTAINIVCAISFLFLTAAALLAGVQ